MMSLLLLLMMPMLPFIAKNEPSVFKECLTRISHTISSEEGQDVASDCRSSPTECDKCELDKLGSPVLLEEETRVNFSATFPEHNRYFSNGDKPWVILVNLKGRMILVYNSVEYTIQENELVLFDDNVPHSWIMQNNDMKIYYYRSASEKPVYSGTYCLDTVFH